MSEINDGEAIKLRDAVVEKIKAALPTTTFTGNLIHDYDYVYESEHLVELLSAKTWLDVVSNPNIFYYLSDVDFLQAIGGDAYHYYLPALLIATLLHPEKIFYSRNTYQQISEIATSLTIKQLKAIMGYLEYQEKFLSADIGSILPNFESESEAIQKTYLRLLNLLYEQGSRAMRDE